MAVLRDTDIGTGGEADWLMQMEERGGAKELVGGGGTEADAGEWAWIACCPWIIIWGLGALRTHVCLLFTQGGMFGPYIPAPTVYSFSGTGAISSQLYGVNGAPSAPSAASLAAVRKIVPAPHYH